MAYSDIEIAEAMVRLAVNKYDFDRTAKQTGISRRTLKRWAKLSPKRGVPELLERAIQRMLMVIPEKWDGNAWAVALGILIDKWLLMQGHPTTRMENVVKGLTEMDEDGYSRVIEEAERILAEASSGGAGSSGGTDEAR